MQERIRVIGFSSAVDAATDTAAAAEGTKEFVRFDGDRRGDVECLGSKGEAEEGDDRVVAEDDRVAGKREEEEGQGDLEQQRREASTFTKGRIILRFDLRA